MRSAINFQLRVCTDVVFEMKNILFVCLFFIRQTNVSTSAEASDGGGEGEMEKFHQWSLLEA